MARFNIAPDAHEKSYALGTVFECLSFINEMGILPNGARNPELVTYLLIAFTVVTIFLIMSAFFAHGCDETKVLSK